ncbi:collagen alpha-1(I) chain-like [Falco peregrinus]|uniref:collagen alpha-1(I) chain-like n=1 Tax=Falco peregrinus TaxID=8954 RepID=UPI002479E922|nr:collagen alpha-1(I) chain-like [Falco peregrinus]
MPGDPHGHLRARVQPAEARHPAALPRQENRRHLTGGAGTDTGTGSPSRPGTRIPTGIPPRPAAAPGPPRDQDSAGIPPAAGAAARPRVSTGSAPPPSLCGDSHRRRDRHRDPRRHSAPASTTCPPADPRDRRTGRRTRSPDGRTPPERGSLPRQPGHGAAGTDKRAPLGPSSALHGALRERCPTGTPRPAAGAQSPALTPRMQRAAVRGGGAGRGPSRQCLGRGGAGRRPTHPEPPRATGVPGVHVPRRRRSPASPPGLPARPRPAARSTPAGPPAAGLLTSAVSLPPSAGAVAGPGDMGAGWRAEPSPCESLRHRPGPSTSISGLSSAPCKRAKSQGRLRSAPLHTCSPGRSRRPGHSPGSPPGPALTARRPPGPCLRRAGGCAPRAAPCPAICPERGLPGLI